ncbi:MAG: MbtH domain protein [Cyanobacteria bacterium J06635_10]
MNELVQRLSQGEHPVEVSLKPEKTITAFQESTERGYIHLKFTETKGGTELGIQYDSDASDLSTANFEQQTGTARIVGDLTLNYVPVKCIADIELETLTGKGHLEIINS